ncbi:MAG TPA: hypothetical protein DIT13_09710 [Verrucomicrobiales bacterium]|nr:hypothetical protein [Verrucomicrobiales bacterium]HRJ09721.1 hypothetical protein [Prosthecobacter sp.]HRK15364.1 hypothetical protein [Prosthecobacter sp.]
MRTNPLFFFAILCQLPALAGAQEVEKYVEINPGTLPVILLAPHGGSLKPEGVAERRFGKFLTDANTADLTRRIADAMLEKYGARPVSILCLMHRSRVDCNRELEEASQGDPVAAAVWERFHGAAAEACKRVSQMHGAGLVLDIHGHRHDPARVELGYLLGAATLDLDDAALDSGDALSRSSIRALVEKSGRPLSEILRGPRSLGSFLEAQGIAAIPGPALPSPKGADYFSGSYNIQAHGSRDGGTVSAIQVECPWEGVRDTPEKRTEFARKLATALGGYFEAHFGAGLGSKK